MIFDFLIKLIAWVACCFTLSVYADEATIRVINIKNPSRYVGVSIGDLLARTITIETPDSVSLIDQALPLKSSQRKGIELRGLNVDMQQKGNKKRYILRFDYQVFASSGMPVQMQLPAEKLKFSGTPSKTVTLPAWRFWFSAQVLDRLLQARQSVIPQYRPELLDIHPAQQTLVVSICLFLIGLVGLIYHYADAAWLPWANGIFANTYRQLKKLPGDASGQRQAILLVQSAFNATLSQQVLVQHIPAFIEKYPKFQAIETEIFHFFEQANAILYAAQAVDLKSYMQDIRTFSRHLRDCERS